MTAMTVREALEQLELSGIRAIVADVVIGDRYGAAGWIMDRPVARIVVVPEFEAAGVPPAGGLAAAVDEIESRLVDLDDVDGPRPYAPHELCTTTHSLVFGGDGPHCGKCGVALTIEPIEPDAYMDMEP